MRAQVAKFSIDPGNRGALETLITGWVDGPGKRLASEGLSVAFEDGGSNRVFVQLVFQEDQGLKSFSDDEETINLVEELKPLVVGRLDFFDADLKTFTVI